MKEPTHAYVGYRADGTPTMVSLDDGSAGNADAVHEILTTGGYVERVTLEAARQVQLYERPGTP